MKTKYLTGLVLLMVACSGGQTSGGDGGQANANLKKAAAEAQGKKDPPPGDICAKNAWYGDGECDAFCQDYDSSDCTPDQDGVVCAAFIEESNGFCSRKVGDPCISQDPDCGPDSTDPPADDPIICPAIALEPDGVCTTDPSNPCLFYEDPDCNAGTGAGGANTGGGSTPTDPGTPACKIAPEPADGVCSRLPSDPCVAADPDCMPDVVCAAYIEQADGVCGRDPSDPCIFQDPDCHVK
jgi:hypothetical protein